ncbi:hypothetical protein EN817_05790 [Mesorhizobium sp. M3A.F.Ca.ET.174.01.1.1]|uniref:hypothetical protein n=1 Tax=unclassified Mesorhizobium TaxID=325217 RepID=UPI001093CD2C|nr:MULTISPECIES: hypothetical protein [unclassified Mesorhizobium]TGS88276.1 hypothetical protein EN818_05790 [Mesorhizobium sp. M3A.F.Ca.ET.175.01.1.1]TGT29221.1 hypothetical protein EN817_05790 [Mesorhizobium sp. M3A.F.Ca.ET.174.01.1.1]
MEKQHDIEFVGDPKTVRGYIHDAVIVEFHLERKDRFTVWLEYEGETRRISFVGNVRVGIVNFTSLTIVGDMYVYFPNNDIPDEVLKVLYGLVHIGNESIHICKDNIRNNNQKICYINSSYGGEIAIQFSDFG